MSSQTTPISLPTLDRLKSKAPDASVEANPLAQKWLGSFSEALEKNDLTAIEKLFLEDALWRDFLALTWDLRSFNTWSNIEKLLKSSEGGLRNPKVLDEVHNKATISSLFPDLCILQFAFDYDTPAGKGSGIVRLVPVGDSGEWKAWTVFTCFETFTNSSPKVGINRSNVPTAESWDAIRQRQIDLVEGPPEVLIIGGAQAGLSIAARLKALGVRSLVAERHARIGDSWRKRYDALCTHDTVWFDHLAYMPFPANWPVYSAAGRLANWLEAYSEAMELSVWTSSEVQKAVWNGADKTWAVTIRRNESEPQVLTVKHVVFATGFGGGIGQSPTIAGEDTFKGKILHSSSFKSSRDYAQQKAVVVGACNSAHDIAQDLIAHDVDVTIYQRSSTYVISNKAVAMLLQGLYNENSNLDFSDRANASLPWEATKLVHQRVAPHIASTMDKETLDGLAKVGFRTNLGPGNAGIFPLLFSRGGGYYIDVGGSKDIIDGRIKLKTGSAIKNFTPTGLEFEDGTQLNADLVVFATGYGDSKDVIESICGPEITSKIPSVWGLDQEGELKSVWRPLAQENLWVAVGNLQMCRFYSNLLALQIKGSLEGLLPKKVA